MQREVRTPVNCAKCGLVLFKTSNMDFMNVVAICKCGANNRVMIETMNYIKVKLVEKDAQVS